jgi:ATP-dependent Clp protease adapter protein ClpS
MQVAEKTNTVVKIKVNNDIAPPKLYSVIYYNDDKTPAAFVTTTLVNIFNLSVDRAVELTKRIDETGSSVVIGGLSNELATHLRDLVLVEVQLHGYPLKVEVKPE